MLSETVAAAPIALPSGTVPDWIHVLPAGEICTKDGRGPYTLPDAAQLIARSMAAGKLAIDENHSTDLAAPQGQPSPARGWIVELQQRADGIWARVEWTNTGRQIMASKEYRGVSPVIAHDSDNVVRALRRASLTNAPNLEGLSTLHSREATAGLTASEADVAAMLGISTAAYVRERGRGEGDVASHAAIYGDILDEAMVRSRIGRLLGIDNL